MALYKASLMKIGVFGKNRKSLFFRDIPDRFIVTSLKLQIPNVHRSGKFGLEYRAKPV